MMYPYQHDLPPWKTVYYHFRRWEKRGVLAQIRDTLVEQARAQAGMVLTVEPGVYVSGFGGVRLEQMVLVTPDGCELLTHAPVELREY